MWLWNRDSKFTKYGSTLQCDTWLWDDDMPLNSSKRPPYWNSTSSFDFDHITAVNMSFCTSLRNFIQIGPPLAEKKQELSYRQQIARQLRTQYAEGIYRHTYYTVTLKSKLRVTQGHGKRNHWIDHTRLSSSRVI